MSTLTQSPDENNVLINAVVAMAGSEPANQIKVAARLLNDAALALCVGNTDQWRMAQDIGRALKELSR
jgi:sugar/nucleoside kinase (ribokinase family)